MGIRDFAKRLLGGSSAAPANYGGAKAGYFQHEATPIMQGFNPQLREAQDDIAAAWSKSAARATAQIQNSGFIAGTIEVIGGGTVGAGLNVSARPDVDALGWKPEFERKWSAEVEAKFRAWGENPTECDAAGQLTFGQMQQAAFSCYMVFGEILALMPWIKRNGDTSALTKVALTPPTRLTNHTAKDQGWVQGVKVDAWNFTKAYRLRQEDKTNVWKDVDIPAFDRFGRKQVLFIKDPAIATTRGISPFAPVLKVTRQVDQYADATLTAALLQTIFAATIKTNLQGLAAFEGLMTEGDQAGSTAGALDLDAFFEAKGDFYDSAKIDLSKHGRIAQLFPNDELEFKEAKTAAADYDTFMGWLLREIARGAGTTYEGATGDYRGATYSSVRMASAIDWLTVLRRRANIVVPFCKAIYEAWLDEQIERGFIAFPGGFAKYKEQRALVVRSTWSGPPKPQADDFKTARAFQVLKEMGAITLERVCEEYGLDWDDLMRQQKRENDYADELDIPRPWAITDPMQKPEGEELALKDPGNDGSGERQDSDRSRKSKPAKKGAGRNPSDREPTSSDTLNAALEAELAES